MAGPTYARCYMRVSTEEQAQSGYSLAAQRDKLELFARLQGYEVGGWYRDDGVSAKDLNRPEFRRMMEEASTGDVILVYKLDRLTRSVRDLDDLLRQFDKRGLHFRSVTEQFDTTTATGRLMIRMVGEFAQWERETIAERTAFGKQKKRAAGEWGGGRPPFGYRLVPSDRTKAGRRLLKLVPDLEAASIVVRIFERYLAGHGIRSIAVWLNEEVGARSALGRPFDAGKVARILQNPMYIGMLRSGPGTPVAGDHEPLVAPELFRQVQETFRLRKRMAPRQATGTFLLSGIARCGVCGGGVGVVKASRRSRQAGQYGYRCRNYAYGGGCGGKGGSLTSSPGPETERRLVEAIARVGVPPHLEAFYAELAAMHQRSQGLPEGEAREIRRQAADAERAILRWDRLYETGRLETEAYLKRVQPHRERLSVLRRRLEEADRAPAPLPEEALGGVPVSFPEIWAEADPHERKVLLQHFVSAWDVTICLYPGQRLAFRPALPPAALPASPEHAGE